MQENLGAHTEVLARSYRSAPAIIHWVNALFSAGQLPDFQDHETERSGWGRVEIAPLVAPDAEDDADEIPFRNPLSHARPDPENTRALREGRLIAGRINELVAARWATDSADAHAIGYGDILILIRKRTHLQALEQALTEAEIPFTGAARGTLLQTIECRDLLALLRFLHSPMRDLDLAQVLRSPIFGIGDDALMQLAARVHAQGGNWIAALEAAGSTPLLATAQRQLAEWRALARRLPVHDLLDRICSSGNLAARYESALPSTQAARVRGNLDRFIQLALTADSGRYPSLSRFIAELEAAQDDRNAPDEAPPPAQSAQVRIMTIHAAKGLEAAAVFLAQCGPVQDKAHSGWLVEWPAGDDRPSHFMLGAASGARDQLSQALLERRQARETAEQMNLLYVAVTRARQFLHISGFAHRRASSAGCWHELAGQAFDALPGCTQEETRRVYASGEPSPALRAPETPAAPSPDPRLRQAIDLSSVGTTRPSGEAAVQDAEATDRGSAIHWLIEQLCRGENSPTAARLAARLQKTPDAEEFAQWLDEARALIAAPELATFFDRTRIRRAWNEVPISHGRMHGAIDRLVDDGTTLWVLDYKTHRQPDAGSLLAEYRGQLLAYREGVRQLWPGRPVRAGLVLTQTRQWLEL
ncbi:MAG TPA: 3'-5' exonuclease, partial [Stenotrophobium sp.]|nr:3'-5' exonuclease [Stenotrophobium sp.]